jgi:hypothetical protein
MQRMYAGKQGGSIERARPARRIGVTAAFAALSAILVSAPASLLLAQQQGPSPAPTSAMSAPPGEPGPEKVYFKRIEVFGNVLSAVREGAGKTAKTKSATIQASVVTSEDPLPMGNKAILFRKVDAAGTGAWVKIAEVTLRKVDASNAIKVDIDVEEKDVLVDGKKADHFAKNVSVKLQVDVKVTAAP